jgi:hypothetical protein
MIAREDQVIPLRFDVGLAERILSGNQSLQTPGLLADLRLYAFDKLRADNPKYPALAHARKNWTGED